MDTPVTGPMTGAKAVRQARRIALALLAGQALFLGITALLILTGSVPRGPAEMTRTLTAACVLVFAVLVPVAFLLRRRLLAPSDAGLGVPSVGEVPDADAELDAGAAPSPENLLRAHIVFFALCEMTGLLCLVAALVQGTLLPCALLALLAMGIQATNVPRDGEKG